MASPKNQTQSPHWAEKLVTQLLAWQKENQLPELHVDDMKTPSGRVHTGALRGVLLHDLIFKVLLEKKAAGELNVPVVSTYVFNDMDPMDGLPAYLDKDLYDQHMGKPMYKIPTPELEKSGINFVGASAAEKQKFAEAKSFAEFYALDFIEAFRRLGCSAKIVWSHELYESGAMDEYIRISLNSIEKIKKVYEEVADYHLPAEWYPFQAICPVCGKVGTTTTTGWDGNEVTFICEPNKVTWAKGCGYQGKVSPFGGTGKLLWKMDWPAHWSAMGVNVEGAGKDHTSAGGSRDMANVLIKEVFNKTIPFDMPYEWILIRGAKMSSSKGVGTSAREFIELFPPSVGRFLFVSRLFSQVIDFDPSGETIPDLFDDYDMGARIYWEQETGDKRLARSFQLAQVSEVASAYFLPRFRDVAKWMQQPEIDLAKRFAEIKGSELNAIELQELADRQEYAKVWLARYAPENYRLQVVDMQSLPLPILSTEQVAYLGELEQLIESNQNWDPAVLQQALYELAKKTLGARSAFEAIYLTFLGKKAGPRAAWFLLELDSKWRKERIAALKK